MSRYIYKRGKIEKSMKNIEKNRNAVSLKLPKKETVLESKNFYHSMRVPFVIYADFECFTDKIHSCEKSNDIPWIEKFQHHKPSGFCYIVKTTIQQKFFLFIPCM